MKLTYIFLPILIQLYSFSAVSGKKDIFLYPAPGVICDTLAGYCADSEGISLGLTRDFLGNNAEDVLEQKLGNTKNLKEFTLSNGVHCDSNERQCYVERYYPRTEDKKEREFTNRLFN